MINYRTFSNIDPPKILQLWKRSGTTRGFGTPMGCDTMEQLIFAKPYFDRNGLFLAFAEDKLVGLAHAGFGCNDAMTGVDTSLGTICMLMVDPDFRHQGIGSELLRMGQEYLRNQGCGLQYAGCFQELTPFYSGLYGGSEQNGVLESDREINRFLTNRDYVPVHDSLVYQRPLDRLPPLVDKRIAELCQRVELLREAWPMPGSWWHACVMGPMVSLRYELLDRSGNTPIGRAWVWEMENFGRAWGIPAVGITDFVIDEPYRRQGFGKLLLHSILRDLKEQQIGMAEIQLRDRNNSGRGLCEKLGFMNVDSSRAYRLSVS